MKIEQLKLIINTLTKIENFSNLPTVIFEFLDHAKIKVMT